jgi:hypothetical protein
MAKTKKVQVYQRDGETDEQALARTFIDPALTAALLMIRFPPGGFDLEIGATATAINMAVAQVKAGDLSDVEAMLVSQSKALQAMFIWLAKKATEQTNLTAYQSFMQMALKAQSNSRSTLQTLLDLKFPRTTAFVKQQNIANGPQQVNNGTQTGAAENHTQETETEQSKLLEDTRHERKALDFGAAATTGGTDKELATVGKVHRAKDKSRKAKSL